MYSLSESRIRTPFWVTGEKYLLDEDYFSQEDFKNISFGNLIKLIRYDLNLSASDLAKEAHVSQAYISQIENGSKIPSNKVISKLSHAFTDYVFHQDLALNFESIDLSYEPQHINMIISASMSRCTFLYETLLIETKEANEFITNSKLGDDIGLENDEKELVNLYRSFNQDKKKQAISYMKFLKQN